MDRTNSRTLLVKAASFLGVASLSLLISLPGLSQQSPNNTSPTVPSTTKPTNPGGQDAGTTNGGENLNRVPSSGSTTQPNNSTGSQNSGTPESADPTLRPDPVNRVEGRDQGSPQDRTNSAPSGSSSQPDANQPGSTTGGDASQQQPNGGSMRQNGGSMQQRNRTTPQSGGQYQNQQGTPQSDTNSGSTTDSQSTSQENNTNGSVRALW